MSEVVACPTCGARCRLERDATTGVVSLVHLQDRQLIKKVEQLKGALLRVRAAVKAETRKRPPNGSS